jgi:membrane protein required for beta-lactamase induction
MLNLDCQINLSAKMIPNGIRGSEWKLNWLLLSIFVVVLCSGCGKSAKSSAAVESSATTASAASASAAEEPAFKIAEEQRKALEQAKQLELDLQNAADKQKREIEAATGEK